MNIKNGEHNLTAAETISRPLNLTVTQHQLDMGVFPDPATVNGFFGGTGFVIGGSRKNGVRSHFEFIVSFEVSVHRSFPLFGLIWILYTVRRKSKLFGYKYYILYHRKPNHENL